eukprot:1160506-Pelagomonas_calceolata.AAC.3
MYAPANVRPRFSGCVHVDESKLCSQHVCAKVKIQIPRDRKGSAMKKGLKGSATPAKASTWSTLNILLTSQPSSQINNKLLHNYGLA